MNDKKIHKSVLESRRGYPGGSTPSDDYPGSSSSVGELGEVPEAVFLQSKENGGFLRSDFSGQVSMTQVATETEMWKVEEYSGGCFLFLAFFFSTLLLIVGNLYPSCCV